MCNYSFFEKLLKQNEKRQWKNSMHVTHISVSGNEKKLKMELGRIRWKNVKK